jgi:hypothetical protein
MVWIRNKKLLIVGMGVAEVKRTPRFRQTEKAAFAVAGMDLAFRVWGDADYITCKKYRFHVGLNMIWRVHTIGQPSPLP